MVRHMFGGRVMNFCHVRKDVKMDLHVGALLKFHSARKL